MAEVEDTKIITTTNGFRMVNSVFVFSSARVININTNSSLHALFRHITEHDIRDDYSTRRGDKGRRVTFKATRGGPAGRGRFSEKAIRHHLDNDEEMGDELGISTKVSKSTSLPA